MILNAKNYKNANRKKICRTMKKKCLMGTAFKLGTELVAAVGVGTIIGFIWIVGLMSLG